MTYFKHSKTGQIVTPEQMKINESQGEAVFNWSGNYHTQSEIESWGWVAFYGQPPYKGMPQINNGEKLEG